MDDRLDKVIKNTRFKKLKTKSNNDVEIDERFKKFSKINKKKIVDKRGRIIQNKSEFSEIYKVPDSSEDTVDNEADASSQSETELNKENYKDDQVDDLLANESSVISTSRLAVTNLNWSRINATDIYVFLNTFCLSSDLTHVKIYQSELGKTELAREEIEGPCFEEISDEDDDEKRVEQIRKYLEKKAKYFYAIVEFDSKESALNVYNRADGIEIEKSGITLQLSFVPDEMEFSDEPTDSCCEVPLNYVPHNFEIKALSQTKPKLDWDEPDTRRTALTMKSEFHDLDLDNIDKYDPFLAPPSDEENKELYSNLFVNNIDDPIQDVDDSLSLSSGLIEMSDQEEPANLISFSDPFLTTKPVKRKLTQPKHETTEVKSNEMELLMMDPNEDDRHFDYRDDIKKKRFSTTDLDDEEIDMEDNRFSAIYKSHNYAIDPSSSKFKSTSNMQKLLKHQTKKRRRSYN